MSDADTITVDNDVTSYRASSLGGCIKSLVAARLGIPRRPPSAQTQSIMDEGKLHEPVISAWLADQGWTVGGDQTEVQLPITPSIFVRGHVDGFAERHGASHVLEIKTASTNVFEKLMDMGFEAWLESRRTYAWQIASYMHATELPALYLVGERAHEDGSPTLRGMQAFVIPEPPVSYDDIRRKVIEIEVMARNEEYPSCDADSWWCSYPDICDAKQVETDKLPDGLSEDVATYAAMKRQHDILTDDLKELKLRIVAKAGEGNFSDGRHVAKISRRKRSSPNMKELKKDLGEEFERYLEETFFFRLEVSEA